jgi:hypothetical protein
MCVDCVLASLRIAQVDPGNEPLPEVVLSHTPVSPSREPNPHRSRSPSDSPHRHRRKEEEDPHMHIDKNTTRGKLERLRSGRLIHRDPKATKLDMQRFQKQLLLNTLTYAKHVW